MCNYNQSNSNVMGANRNRNCHHKWHHQCGNEPQVIAYRGPGCISGTGRCGRYTEEFLEANNDFENCNFENDNSVGGEGSNGRNWCWCWCRCYCNHCHR